jgi:hypothetical protein
MNKLNTEKRAMIVRALTEGCVAFASRLRAAGLGDFFSAMHRVYPAHALAVKHGPILRMTHYRRMTVGHADGCMWRRDFDRRSDRTSLGRRGTLGRVGIFAR